MSTTSLAHILGLKTFTKGGKKYLLVSESQFKRLAKKYTAANGEGSLKKKMSGTKTFSKKMKFISTVSSRSSSGSMLKKSKIVLGTKHGPSDHSVPAMPVTTASGNLPAVSAARVNIARNIITRRRSVGLTQKALAEAAGIRVETLNRIEKAKVSPDFDTIDKIENALSAAAASVEK